MTVHDIDAIVEHWTDTRDRWPEYGPAFRARIIAYMAGGEAEVAFFGDYQGGDGDDREKIGWMLDSLLPEDADVTAYEARLRRFTRAMVRRHRDKIEAVATALLTSKHLSAGQLDAITSAKVA